MSTALAVAALLMILIGLLGTVLPLLPGIPLMFAGMWLYAHGGGYSSVSVGCIVLLGVLTLLALAVDLLASVLGAKRVGASRTAVWGAALGSLLGLFFGLPGLLLGPYFGAAGGELAQGAALAQANRVALGTWLGLLLGAVFKIGLALAMLAMFLLALWLP